MCRLRGTRRAKPSRTADALAGEAFVGNRRGENDMKFIRSQMTHTVLLLLGLFLSSSCESTSETDEATPWLELRIEKSSGAVPDTVTFVGTLHGDMNWLRVSVPDDLHFCPGTYPKGCIDYQPGCGSTQPAKRTYVETYIYQSPGTYQAKMLLHCCHGSSSYTISDTIGVYVP